MLKPTRIPITTKSLPGSTTREHRKLINVKTVPLGTNCDDIVLFVVLPGVKYGLQSKMSHVLLLLAMKRNYYYQSRKKSQKVTRKHFSVTSPLGGLHDEDNLCGTLKGMISTNIFMSKRFIEYNYSISRVTPIDSVGLLSSTHGQRSQQESGQITIQSISIKSKFLMDKSCRKKKKKVVSTSMAVEALSR